MEIDEIRQSRIATETAKREQAESDRICEEMRLQLVELLATAPDTKIVKKNHHFISFGEQSKHPSRYNQKFVARKIPEETGPIPVEIRGFYPSDIDFDTLVRTAAKPQDIIVSFPGESLNFYLFRPNINRRYNLDEDCPTIGRATGYRQIVDDAERGGTRVPLQAATALKDRVVNLLLSTTTQHVSSVEPLPSGGSIPVFTPNPA